MEKMDIVSDYETLLIQVEDCRKALEVVFSWLNRDINQKDKFEVYKFLELHDSRLAVLNLVMDRLDFINTYHRPKIEQIIKEG